tara:strand:- start:36 stop:344 length:309 start_codon:yes stop_codon:yes gene_type:complete
MQTMKIKKWESDKPQTSFSLSDEALLPFGMNIAIKHAREIAPIEPLQSKKSSKMALIELKIRNERMYAVATQITDTENMRLMFSFDIADILTFTNDAKTSPS